MDAVAEHAPRGRSRRRDLQRLPGAHRGRLLPGALQKNAGLRFLCDTVDVPRREHTIRAHVGDRAGRGAAAADQPLRGQLHLRPAHARPAPRRRPRRAALRRQPQRRASTTSPGSATRRGNVVGLMPHPERAIEALLGSRRRRGAAAVAPRRGRDVPRRSPPSLRLLLPRWRARRGSRVMSARLSTSAGTPSSRQVAYAMPFDSP